MSREEIIAANPIVEFVRGRGHELKSAGLNFVTNGCPVTEHKKKWHRPVGIDVKKQLWFCNDCGLGGTVIDWVMREKGCDAAQAMRELGGGGNDQEERGLFVCAYDYTDESGNLLYQTCRYQPKKFRQRRPDGGGGWKWNLKGVRRVLYRLPEVIAASAICVAEGEKDCDNLVKLGFVATTNPMGAGKWRDQYSETLRGKDVVVFGDVGDEDGAGERHTNQVIESLVGKAKSIKRVTLPDGFHDVSDYIASLPHETAGETIRRLIDETPEIDLAAGEPLKDGEPGKGAQAGPADDTPEGDFTPLGGSAEIAYPSPPDDAAYYGLAGDIVRRIEPHTEADPVALLVQILVVFGNVIGRSAHMRPCTSQICLRFLSGLLPRVAKALPGRMCGGSFLSLSKDGLMPALPMDYPPVKESSGLYAIRSRKRNRSRIKRADPPASMKWWWKTTVF
jgi:hypothetical protein